MSAADVLQWENAAELGKLQAQWVQEAEAAGLKNAPAVLEKMRALHAQAMAREK